MKALSKYPQIPKAVLESSGVRTSRQWKAKKRAELKKLQKAFFDYRLGCAWCPDYLENHVDEIRKHLDDMEVSHSRKNWG